MVFIIVLLGVLGNVAMMKLVTPATMTLPAQAQSLADLVRRAQSLAVARGQRMGVSVTTSGADGSVAIACAASAPCSTDATLTVSQGAVLASASPIYFNSLGQPLDSAGTPLTTDASFMLSYATGATIATFTVTVSALTGRVSVNP
jgi:hypothetical protein